eukprot:13754900-Alexandrium_andersonii.AAC.1
MRHCLRRSQLELRGPRNGLRVALRSSGGMRSALLLRQTPNLPTKPAGGCAVGAFRTGPGGRSPPRKTRATPNVYRQTYTRCCKRLQQFAA